MTNVFSCRILRWLMDEEEQVKVDYQTRIQFLIVEMSRECPQFFFPLLHFPIVSIQFHIIVLKLCLLQLSQT